MSLPPIREGVRESVGAYVLRRLVDAGDTGILSCELHIGVPDHISPTSPSVAAGGLYRMGVLHRRLENNGKGGVRYRYTVADIDKLPKNFSWECRYKNKLAPHQRCDVSPRSPSDIFNKADEPPTTTIATLPGVGHSTHDEADFTHRINPPAPIPAHNAHGFDDGAAFRHTQPRHDPPVSAPPDEGPHLLLVTHRGLRRYSILEAKTLYRQLQEVFG